MELRPATWEEFDDFGRAALSAFHQELNDADRERYARIDEPERSLAWFDDGRIVATTGAYTRELTVPGAVVRCAAVTAVAVVATHRRRGLLTAMMRRQLEDLRERGDSVAALWASEGGIYGRFGYGIAARAARLVARRPAARLAGAPAGGGAPRAGPPRRGRRGVGARHGQGLPPPPGVLDPPPAGGRDPPHRPPTP